MEAKEKMDEIIKKIIDVLTSENNAFNDDQMEILADELIQTGIIKPTNMPGELGTPEVIPELYEKLGKIDNIKEIIFAAVSQDEDTNKGELAEVIFRANPLAFISPQEIDEFLKPDKIAEPYLRSVVVSSLIEATNNISKYLKPEILKDFELYSEDIARLIFATGNIEEYLTPEQVKAFELYQKDIERLILATGNIEKYLTPEQVKAFELDSWRVESLIEATGNIEKYLTSEQVKALDLKGLTVARLIKATGKMEEYLTVEKIKDLGLRGLDISRALFEEDEIELGSLIDFELSCGTYSYNKIKRLSEIINDLKDSNSGRLSRIKREVAQQVYTLPEEEQQDTIEAIKNIYLTTDIPTFAQNFLVFKQLHPTFLEESNTKAYLDYLQGNIPSLEKATPLERNHIIFSDLLRITLKSNNRNLRDYLSIIEQGDKLFQLYKEGKIAIDASLPENDKKILQKYSNILNALYNQTSKGKRLEKLRVNSGDLAQDLNELDSLFSNDTHIQRSLPDRIVRMFGYWAGIKDFNQAKRLIEEISREADKRNRDRAQKGDFTLREGDFAKGIEHTEYFSQMLQNGIVAKDYLGENSESDQTPLDMDVELINEEGKIKTASKYVNVDADGRRLGKIILVIKNDGSYVKTREGHEINSEAIKTVIQDRTKREYFDNNGVGGENAYGIRTGIGSTNISYIISDRYVDKLGLEIAINGFYIPIVDERGKVLFTPEMYDDLRSKMQGMSYYGVPEFELDESAKNEGTKQIAQLIEQNVEEVNQKRQKVLQTLRKAIEKCGLQMSDKRKLDLIQGFVEVVDTGSTGRGTNEPGDGDFDFMIRLDNSIMNDPERIKEELRRALSAISEPIEETTTMRGDFRYKGVSIQGLEDKVDIDLTFAQRTDEIEYTTEECIRDRLETIKRNNPEDYQYAVANILLAKKVLKTEGAYKKKNAPAPEEGKKDTRGGLGAVGIENWILQNGGSFEKAARDFLEVSRICESLSEFQSKYAVWDFGENYMSGEKYPHDNFVYNMNEEGYARMKKALEDYIKAIETEQSKSTEHNGSTNDEQKSLGDILQEDMSVLTDTVYMRSVEELLAKIRRTRSKCHWRKLKRYTLTEEIRLQMENIEFSNACYEVLEILKYVRKEDLLKIPKDEIEMLKENANLKHEFTYDPNKDIKEQDVSKLAKGIIAVFFYKYTASEEQRERIKLKQKADLIAIEQEKRNSYKPEEIFKAKSKTEITPTYENENIQLVEYKKENWFIKIINKIKKFFRI